jgi:hypothetical protein
MVIDIVVVITIDIVGNIIDGVDVIIDCGWYDYWYCWYYYW